MWHHRMGLSAAGNDFFCSHFCVERPQSSAGYRAIYYPASSPLSCRGKCNLSWFTQLPLYCVRFLSQYSTVGEREFRETHTGYGRSWFVFFQPHQNCRSTLPFDSIRGRNTDTNKGQRQKFWPCLHVTFSTTKKTQSSGFFLILSHSYVSLNPAPIHYRFDCDLTCDPVINLWSRCSLWRWQQTEK